MSSVQDLVTAIISGKATEIESSFKTAISDKVLDMVSDMKTEMAQGIFKEEVELDEDASHITDFGDRQKYNALRKMEQDRVSQSKKASSPIKKSHHLDMANKHNSDANDILDKYKLNKEDFESLDELSKDTLGSYVKYASDDRATKSLKSGLSASDTKCSGASDKLLKQADKRKAGIRTALTKLTKEDLDEAVNYSAFIKKYKENEDDNEHSKNVVHLAKHVGSDEDQEEANDILKSHNKAGHLTSGLSSRRDTLHKKLWSPAIQKAYNK